jgi:hypothetical protein
MQFDKGRIEGQQVVEEFCPQLNFSAVAFVKGQEVVLVNQVGQ